jgi:hypothetical protein
LGIFLKSIKGIYEGKLVNGGYGGEQGQWNLKKTVGRLVNFVTRIKLNFQLLRSLKW